MDFTQCAMSLNKQDFDVDFTKYFDLKNLPKQVAVAVSGGCDSLALTLILDDFCKKNKIDLFAITINHKMRENSNFEAKEVGKILTQKQVFHQILEVQNSKIFAKNIEAKMREIRYELLLQFCQNNQIKHLFLGHQINDLAENFLIRIFRGSGLDGLSTMSEILDFKKIKLIRPLLNISKNELKSYLIKQNIAWFEDETNKDEKFLRNKIRNFLESFEDHDLIAKRIKNSTDEIAEIREYFDDLMLKYAQEILEFSKKKQPKFVINLEKLKEVEKKFALKILALVFMEISQRNYKPRFKELLLTYKYLIGEKILNEKNFYGCIIKNKKNFQVEIIKNLAIKNNSPNIEFSFKTSLGKILKI